MNSLTRNAKIANMFMLAESVENYYPPERAICMPKLNGIRAMWIPGSGFWSRDGIQYSPDVTAHIEIESTHPVDGEFYVHGWPLQRINGAIGVNLDQPVEDTTKVEFHAFDLYMPQCYAEKRMELLVGMGLKDAGNFEVVGCPTLPDSSYNTAFETFVNNGYEGMMLKSPYVGYIPGRTKQLLKRKNWRTLDAKVVELCEGRGELAKMFGGAVMETAAGVRFNAGCGKGLTHVERIAVWNNPSRLLGTWRKIRYIELSEDGKPLNATFVLV